MLPKNKIARWLNTVKKSMALIGFKKSKSEELEKEKRKDQILKNTV